MLTHKLTVKEPLGLHMRSAGILCETGLTFKSKILLKKGNHTANAKSMLGLLAARVTQGDEIELICDGPDEEEAMAALIEILDKSLM